MNRNIKLVLITITLLLVLGNSAYNWTSVESKIAEKIAEGHFTGCVLGVYNSNGPIYRKSFGTVTPKWGLYANSVNLDTYFDINFLTQVIAINSGFMQLYDQQRLNVTDRPSKWIFDFDNNGKRPITIANLMLHNSGLQATYP